MEGREMGQVRGLEVTKVELKGSWSSCLDILQMVRAKPGDGEGTRQRTGCAGGWGWACKQLGVEPTSWWHLRRGALHCSPTVCDPESYPGTRQQIVWR